MLAAPLKSITGGSLASANNCSSRPRCLPLTVCKSLPTSEGDTPPPSECRDFDFDLDLDLDPDFPLLGVCDLDRARLEAMEEDGLLPDPPPGDLARFLEDLELEDRELSLEDRFLPDLCLDPCVCRLLFLDRDLVPCAAFLGDVVDPVGLEAFRPYLRRLAFCCCCCCPLSSLVVP